MAEIIKMTKISFASGSLQNPTLATLTIIKANTQIGIPIGCCSNSMKNLNGFLMGIVFPLYPVGLLESGSDNRSREREDLLDAPAQPIQVHHQVEQIVIRAWCVSADHAPCRE